MEDLSGKQLGPYQIVSRLGIGGMATVYKAYQPKMDRYVALKVLLRHFSKHPDFIHRFSQEARLIAKLEHPHILSVYDYGESDSYTYLVMQLVEGGSLSDLLQKHGKLELSKINSIISQTGGALDYAHKEGVIHRDFKPSNVLIDKFDNCLLTDFGIAKMVEATSHLTQTGGILGTPTYVSPEQGSGKPIDCRSDIYSLGVVLYQMIVGDVPYKADTPMAVIFKHIQDPLPLPRQQVPELPEPVERVILKALAKNPDDRYATAADLVNALQSAIAQPIIQIPITKTSISKEEFQTKSLEKTRLETVKSKEVEKKKTPPGHKEKVRTGRGWVYGVVAIFLLAVFAGAGWYYYDKIFISEHILSVESIPAGADVYVDGGHIGISPVQVEELTPGTHKILISKDRYQDYKEYLFIEEGKPRVIQAKLAPKPFGDLEVNSNPLGAEVIIDDDKRGITPISIEDLPKGTHRVMVKKEGFDPWQDTIEIISMEKAQISANLITIYGGLNISSSPSEADVYVDGKKEGKTPLVLKEVQKGRRIIKLKKVDFDVWKKEVYVKAAEVFKIKAVLGISYGDLKVLSTPNDAEVIINGMSKGKTPLIIHKLSKGKTKIEIKKEGYEKKTLWVSLEAGEDKTLDIRLNRIAMSISNNLGMEFVYIPPGTFTMGSPSNEPGRNKNEKQHQVTLTQGFYMQTTEVTVGQWRAFVRDTAYRSEAETEGYIYIRIGKKLSKEKGLYWDKTRFSQTESNPVTCVSWNDVQSYIKWLNQKEGNTYRLPTESQWEYACRAGSITAFANGGISEINCGYDPHLNAMGWYCGNSKKKTHPVAKKKPNDWGLYDMHGNVWEWCQEWYGKYPSSLVANPTGPPGGTHRVIRGGHFNKYARHCRSALRGKAPPDARGLGLGFRLLRNP
jgi:formylglycine-generating enzyme required for sulfatase activity/serine/threonine protein kinase